MRTLNLLVNRPNEPSLMATLSVDPERIRAVAALLAANGLFSAIDSGVSPDYAEIPLEQPAGEVGEELRDAILDAADFPQGSPDAEDVEGIVTLGLQIYPDATFVVSAYHKHSSEAWESEIASAQPADKDGE